MSKHFHGSLEEYAAVRAAEAREALALANVHDVRSLGCDDQEAIHHAGFLARQVEAVIDELRRTRF